MRRRNFLAPACRREAHGGRICKWKVLEEKGEVEKGVMLASFDLISEFYLKYISGS